jgi:hypothetical protein
MKIILSLHVLWVTRYENEKRKKGIRQAGWLNFTGKTNTRRLSFIFGDGVIARPRFFPAPS